MTKPTTYRPAGTCPTCGRDVGLRRSDGVIGFHRQRDAFIGDTVHMMSPQPPCPGWKAKPGAPA